MFDEFSFVGIFTRTGEFNWMSRICFPPFCFHLIKLIVLLILSFPNLFLFVSQYHYSFFYSAPILH